MLAVDNINCGAGCQQNYRGYSRGFGRVTGLTGPCRARCQKHNKELQREIRLTSDKQLRPESLIVEVII